MTRALSAASSTVTSAQPLSTSIAASIRARIHFFRIQDTSPIFFCVYSKLYYTGNPEKLQEIILEKGDGANLGPMIL